MGRDRPVLLDLFCCGGGGAEGYIRAGFDVIGVDIEPHAYPGEFHCMDAFEAIPLLAGRVDAIHASPPCQAYTQISVKHRGRGTLADERKPLIRRTRDALRRTGLPFVIENVPGARREMPGAVVLTGAQFGLGVHRPRLFEAYGFEIPALPRRGSPSNAIGVYGDLDGRRLWTRKDGSELRAASTLEQAREAMGYTDDRLSWCEITESIPPAYTEHVGRALLRALQECTLSQ